VVHLDCDGCVCSAAEAKKRDGLTECGLIEYTLTLNLTLNPTLTLTLTRCGIIECDVSGIHFYGLREYERYQWHLQYEAMVSKCKLVSVS